MFIKYYNSFITYLYVLVYLATYCLLNILIKSLDFKDITKVILIKFTIILELVINQNY